MKICIVQKQMFPYFGVMAISGIMKHRGHQMDVLIAAAESDIVAALKGMEPDLIGFSVMSSEHGWLVDMVSEIKRCMPETPIAVGGVHAVLYPADVLDIEGVDYVCNGEGDVAFPLLVDRLAEGERSAEGISGIAYRKNGAPIMQGVPPLASDLDSFMEDREVYYNRYPLLKNLSQKMFMSSRGCPFNCSFCANGLIMHNYKGRGKYIRRKSPQHMVTEVKDVVDKYGATSIFFSDDLFVCDFAWLEEFTALYKAQVGIPYMGTGYVKLMKEKHAKVLADSGCHTISVGLETGNEELRQNILNKKISNKDIEECAMALRDAGIELQTSNMFCLPEETIEDAISTIDLNIKIGTKYMFTAVFLPFPKTELARYCSDRGMLKKDYSFEDMPESFVVKSALKVKDRDYLINLHKVAHLCLRFPKFKRPLVLLASKVRFDRLFAVLYIVGTFIRYKEERKLTFLQTISHLWSYRKGYG